MLNENWGFEPPYLESPLPSNTPEPVRRKKMKKIIIFLIIPVIFFSCEMPNGDSGSHDDDKPWFYNQALEVAYMFGYNLINESNPVYTQNAYNYFIGPNERTGVCLDYAIYFALLTDSYVIISPPNTPNGIYEIIGECEVPVGGYNTRFSGNGIIARSQDRTEAWYLEKVMNFDPGMGMILNDGYDFINHTANYHWEYQENHSWNLTKDDWIVDVTRFDAMGTGLYRDPDWWI